MASAHVESSESADDVTSWYRCCPTSMGGMAATDFECMASETHGACPCAGFGLARAVQSGRSTRLVAKWDAEWTMSRLLHLFMVVSGK
jgi:hypothetical protein